MPDLQPNLPKVLAPRTSIGKPTRDLSRVSLSDGFVVLPGGHPHPLVLLADQVGPFHGTRHPAGPPALDPSGGPSGGRPFHPHRPHFHGPTPNDKVLSMLIKMA